MPWWQIRVFAEGLEKEFSPDEDDEYSTGTYGDDDHDATDLSDLGFNVRTDPSPNQQGSEPQDALAPIPIHSS